MTDDPRLAVYATMRQLSPTRARAELVTIALNHLEARRRGGQVSQDITQTERSRRGRAAVTARWDRARAAKE